MTKISQWNNTSVYIAPSILSADFTRLGEEINAVVEAGAEIIHFDVMDGHFVPNISFGIPVLASIRKATDAPFDVHLMISEPKRYAPDFIKAGADMIVFHIESDDDVQETIDTVKSLNCDVGISIKPGTPVEELLPYLDQLDMVLVMSVEPGFGGQSFMPDQLDKVRTLRQQITEKGLNTQIQIDGGIAAATAPQAIEAGANVLVAGSAVFKAADYKEIVTTLKG